jgi:2-polyprenyl-3-methyl-5-hydroxy-6-metoxy-1,4-benzoquinol methylase
MPAMHALNDEPAAEEPLPTERGTCALCGGSSGEPLARGFDFEYLTTRREFTFLRCACGAAFLDPRPAPAALPRIYPRSYYSYDFANKLGPFVMRFKAFTERAKVRAYDPYLHAGARVLDIGCGDGHLLRQIGDGSPHALALEGVELPGEAADAARAHGIVVYPGRIEEVALPDGAFDLVIMNQLIEHVRDPVEVLRRVARPLAPGGHLFIETPNVDSLDARLFRRRYWGGYHLPRHFHLFDTRALARLVERAGLVTVAQRPLVCPQFWIISVQNWLKARGAVRLAERVVSPFNPLLLAPVTLVEMVQQRLWWTSNQQLVARLP